MSDPKLPPRAPRRKIGEPFNPWRGSCGFYAPDIVSRERNLKDGPKRLYERLVRWAGRNGQCWYSFETMAAELGKCVRQLKSDMAALEGYGLVAHVRCGKRLANLYRFLWHPILDAGEVQSPAPHQFPPNPGAEVQTDAHHNASKEVQDSIDDGQTGAHGDGQPPAYELCPKNLMQGIASSSAAQLQDSVLTVDLVDDDPSSNETKNGTVRECLTAFVQASGIETPAGKMPVTEIASGLDRIGATIADLVGFLENYAGHWREPPATWRHVLVSFQRWAADPQTKATILGRIALQRAMEEQRQAQVEQQRKLATPVAYGDAVAQLQRARIPWPLKVQLERTGEVISPVELERQAREWQRCSQCRDKGLLGNAIDRDLRFCACPAGEAVRHRDGENSPEKEIAAVHADPRSLLTAASYEVGMLFVGDAVRDSEVRDNGSELEIIPTGLHDRLQLIHESDIARALRRIGWVRSVKIVGRASSQALPTDDGAPADKYLLPGATKVVPRIVDSANCLRCGGVVTLFSDGTGRDCKCRQT